MDELKFKGKLFEVVERELVRTITEEDIRVKKKIKYEFVRRGPGVRAIILNDGKILLNREYRYELDKWDYRLPGGKVFDFFEDYENASERDSISQLIRNKLVDEVREEADIQIIEASFLEVSHCGLTVEWDLYYFLISDNEYKLLPSFFDKNIRKTEYEYIIHEWIDFSDVFAMCLNGELAETRSAYVLMKYLLREGKINYDNFKE